MTPQKKLLFIVIGIVVVLGAIISIASFLPSDKNVLESKDTDESINISEEENPETGGESASVGSTFIFGLKNLSEKYAVVNDGETGAFFDSINEALQRFSTERLNNKYTSLTIRPQDLTINGSVITSTIRLGDTDIFVPITITVNSTKGAAVTEINKDGSEHDGTFVYVSGLDFDSYLYTISQKDSSSSALEIDAPQGYREASLKMLKELGYSVTDFSITFKNYESPFNE